MLPYFEWTTIPLGPLNLHVWGLFVALGFLFGAWMAGWFAQKNGGDKKIIYDLLVWTMIAGLIGGRLGYVFFYDFAFIFQNPLSIFSIWDGGLSFFGGFIASILTAIWFLRKRGVNVWQYAGFAIFGLPFGQWIGRLGCFFIHDHPGTATDFVLGIEYPDGVVRHDHGLYLSISGLILGIFFLMNARFKRSGIFYIASFAIWYGSVRFFLDFLRLNDVRYLHLTPGQYFSIVLIAGGIYLFYRQWRSHERKMTQKRNIKN